MILTDDILTCLDRSVLRWLATTCDDQPNVSPKEIFKHYQSDTVIIDNNASPQTVRNIKSNELVCLGFIEILIQKGFQLKGKTKTINKKDSVFSQMEKKLLKMTGGKYPFSSITSITATHPKPILAPRHLLLPETTEEEQIHSARIAYGSNNNETI